MSSPNPTDSDHPASDAEYDPSQATSDANTDSDREYSVVDSDGEEQDRVVSSKNTLSFYQRVDTFTGRRIPTNKRKRGEVVHLFQTVRKTTKTKIATSKTPPSVMVVNKRQKLDPLERPFAPQATANGDAHRFRGSQRFVGYNNAIAGPSNGKGTANDPYLLSDDEDDYSTTAAAQAQIQEYLLTLDEEDGSDNDTASDDVDNSL